MVLSVKISIPSRWHHPFHWCFSPGSCNRLWASRGKSLVIPETHVRAQTTRGQHRDTTPLKEWRCSSFEVSTVMKEITASGGCCASCATGIAAWAGLCPVPFKPIPCRSVPCLGAPWAGLPLPVRGWHYSPRQHKTSSVLRGGGEMSDASKALAAPFLASGAPMPIQSCHVSSSLRRCWVNRM